MRVLVIEDDTSVREAIVGALRGEGFEVHAAANGLDLETLTRTFVPDSGACMCLFEAESSEAVKRANDEAGIPYDRVVPAMDLTPQ